jgi:hypothetical protein
MASLSWHRPLTRIVSGGQAGAERAGLCAAEACGISTAGWFDESNHTTPEHRQDASVPARFGLRPHAGGRADRIRAHVLDSDATLRLGYNFTNLEDEISRRVLESLDTEFLDVRLDRLLPIQDAADWIVTRRIRTLHVTGNPERSLSALVFTASLAFLLDLFRTLGYAPDASRLRAYQQVP